MADKDGKGDIVRELSDACKKYGIKFAVYLSPWEHQQDDSPDVEYFYKQLKPTGDVSEIWFDGANGAARTGGATNTDRPQNLL